MIATVMTIFKNQNGKWEAIGKIGRGVLAVHFVGFGETPIEAMKNCFGKIINFLTK